MESNKENKILELSFQFALKIIEFSESLEQTQKYIIARQLLKSGTSIGANVREAQSAESKVDFIHKIKIAAKENYPDPDLLLEDIKVIQKILSKILGTANKSK